MLRSQALIRRYTELNPNSKRSYTIVEHDDLSINEEYRKVFLRGQEVDLTGKEFGILVLLVSNPGRVFTYEQIYENVWNEVYYNEKKRVANHVSGLRKKLEGADGIEAVHDVGYRMGEKKDMT